MRPREQKRLYHKNRPRHKFWPDTVQHNRRIHEVQTQLKKSRIRRISKKAAREARARKKLTDAQLAEFPFCEVFRAPGANFETLGFCLGPLHVHEPWTRARGGPKADRRNMVSACDHHNDLISQDADVMAWAHRVGLLVHAHDGPAWLEAGGYKRD
tara:strand:- start:3955 stop:4422 length:468 start_codon:yes stop_codon:yes gene_type:complete